jgi:hypothetical protein
VELNEFANGTVAGLMIAENPSRADVTARQAFQLTQRPLTVDNPIDYQP